MDQKIKIIVYLLFCMAKIRYLIVKENVSKYNLRFSRRSIEEEHKQIQLRGFNGDLPVPVAAP
jgi:hypothetical protein